MQTLLRPGPVICQATAILPVSSGREKANKNPYIERTLVLPGRPAYNLALASALASALTSEGTRGPQREAASSFRLKVSWFRTAGMTAQPGRAATIAGVWPP